MNLSTTPYNRLVYSADHAKGIADGKQQEADELEAKLAILRAEIPQWRAKAAEFSASALKLRDAS